MKFLIIQTAFIGDVVLATPLIEKLKQYYPDASIDFLLRKGNESLLTNHPHLRQVIILDKKNGKYKNLFSLITQIRKEKYDYVINLQRFFASGLLISLSGGKHTIGFDKNPLSFLFSESYKHQILTTDQGNHEVRRNLSLIEKITDNTFVKPKLYPSDADFRKVVPSGEYVCIAPASIWFTKQWPKEKWIELIHKLPDHLTIYLMGAKSDITLCDEIKAGIVYPLSGGKGVNRQSSIIFTPSGAQGEETHSTLDTRHSTLFNLAGKLSFLESAALMQNARMNFVNDSAPLHFASAVNAPVAAMYCSTIPAFGFGPLSDISYVFETEEKLDCRPCGLHGYTSCPKGHFRCSIIDTGNIIDTVFT
jgi:heptosyltransferase-2